MTLFQSWFANHAEPQATLIQQLDALRGRLFELEEENAHLRRVSESQSRIIAGLTRQSKHLRATGADSRQER